MKKLIKEKIQQRYIRVSLKQANIFQLIGEWNKAEKIISTCLKLSKEINNKELNSEINVIFGRILFKKGDFSKLKELTEILKKRKNLNSITKIHLYRNIALLHFNKAEYDIAEKYYIRCLEISLKEKNIEEIIQAYRNLGIIEFYKYNLIKSLFYIRKIKKYSRNSNNKINFANVYGFLGHIFYLKKNYNLAKKNFEKKLLIVKEIGDKFEINNTIGNIGLLYKQLGKYSEALKWYNKCLISAKELGDTKGIASILLNIGNIYREIGDYSKAYEKYKKSIKLHKFLKDIHGLSLSNGNMGYLYLSKEKYNEAIKYINKALIYDNKGNLKNWKLIHLYNKALCLLNLKEYNKTRKCNIQLSMLSKELKKNDILINSQILNERIKFYQLLNSKNKTSLKGLIKPVNKLQKMRNIKNDLTKADINYEIFKMLIKINKCFTF